MARTTRKSPVRKTSRTAERDFGFEPGPWFIPADTSNVTPLRRLTTSDTVIAARLPERIPTRLSLIRGGQYTPPA